MTKRKVIIKSWKQMELEYRLTCEGDINIPSRFTKEMESSIPESRIIELDEDSCWGGWRFSEEMILGDYIALGAEIEVSDDGVDWDSGAVYESAYFFVGYQPFSVCPVRAFGKRKNCYEWKYCRPVQEKPEQAKQTEQEVFDKNGNMIGYFIPKGGE